MQIESPEDHAAATADSSPMTLIARLSKSIPEKHSLLLAIVRIDSEQLLVTIQPTPSEADKGTAIPLQIKGKPEEIDAELITALETYLPARDFAVRSAQEVAEATRAAAEKAKTNATKTHAQAMKTSKHPGKLSVIVEPSDASISLTANSEKFTLSSGVEIALPLGKHTVIVEKDGYEACRKEVTVTRNLHTEHITLVEDLSFFTTLAAPKETVS